MEQIAMIFDYYKKAFHLNRGNRALYKPQIILILIKTCFFIGTGLLLYRSATLLENPAFSYQDFGSQAIVAIASVAILIFLYQCITVVIEAGLYNMYRSCVQYGAVEHGAFRRGVKQYVWPFLLVNVLVVLAWAVLLIPYFIVGIVTLMAGFVLVPLVIEIFTSMWKISMVMEGFGVIAGLKNSFRFANSHFWPLTYLIIIKEAFSSLGRGGKFNFNSSNFNFGNDMDPSNVAPDISTGIESAEASFYDLYVNAIPYIKIGFYIAIPIISIAVFIASFIKMLFNIFFTLSLFVMYHENTLLGNNESVKEVL